MKNYFKNFIKEMIPVVVGVLIALWINNWNENRKDQLYIENFYKSLRTELKETDAEINEKTPSQKMLVDTLNFYLNDENLSLLTIIEKGGGIDAPTIRLNYWKALSNSKIELLPYQKLSLLADIEEGSELIAYKLNKILDFIYSNLDTSASAEKLKLKIMMEELIRSQSWVQEDIHKILKE